ncbi:MAG TPA: hypothetical protein VLI65_01270 [Pyrinomonadaceae bacterium]|nr:hypothetical protein [Pyrinomonadaceae bacterium]
MNTEELELSLRSEFEAHLKNVFADVQQQVADFQSTIDAELGKHRTQMLDALNAFTSKVSAEPPADKAFSQAVVEHLRIARDEGAKLAAKSMADAETMDGSSPNSVSFNFARDAVNDISGQTSQAAILQTLVKHCEHFTPRGVFFIVRNEHFVGWQAFGDESKCDEAAVRDLDFPVTSDTVLSDAISALSTAERQGGTGADVGTYLAPLGFKTPSNMRSIPLVARGRGVAALYVDGGMSDRPVNIEALEMLVRVAGLTVELLASNQAARPAVEAAPVQPAASQKTYQPEPEPMVAAPVETAEQWQQPEPESTLQAEPETAPAWNAADAETVSETFHAAESEVNEPEPSYEVETFDRAEEPVYAEVVEASEPAAPETTPELEASNGFAFTPAEEFEPEVQHFEDADVVETPQFESNGHSSIETTPEPEPQFESNGHSAVVDAPKPETQKSFTGRRVDLPIEVAEEERGTHTKARRFARLLVSEIKLYNEDKVKQGREANDLYNRLKEAIDRSREMYDKRVEPPVSSKFDYFHYELVNDLADGDPNRLGSGYPGAAI